MNPTGMGPCPVSLSTEALNPEQVREGMRRYLPVPVVDLPLTYWRDAMGVRAQISHEVKRITGRPALPSAARPGR